MAEFDKSIQITVNSQDSESIVQALTEYRQRLADGSAFRLHMGTLFNIEFVDQTGKPLSLDDAGDKRDLVAHVLNTYRSDEKSTYISEPVLFACALNFPQLEQELQLTAQAMVDFARSRNDQSDLMLSDMNIFGIEALFIMAKVNPAHSFYLSSFVIPYWNTESWSVPFQMFMALVEEFGWSRDLIKAYIWSDGAHIRRHFYMDRDGYQQQPDLLDHLNQNPDDYAWFKQQLIERLGQQPMISVPVQSSEHPTLSFYYSLGAWDVPAPYYEDEQYQDQVKQQTILGSRVDEEAFNLLAEVKAQYPGVSLTKVAPAWQLEDRYAQWEHTRIVDDPFEDEDSEPEEVWSEAEWKSCFYPLNPNLPLVNISEFESIDHKLMGLDDEMLEYLPTHIGGCAYAAWRLNDHIESEPEEHELLAWLEQHLLTALTDKYKRYTSLQAEELADVQTWLSQVDCGFNDREMISLLAESCYRDCGRSGDMVSPNQPAYALLGSKDGYQRAILALFWLMEVFARGNLKSDLEVLVKRHWTLWVTLAPQRVINRIFHFRSDYPLYGLTESQQLEEHIVQCLASTGVAQSDIDVYLLMTYQSASSYRPVSARFWQSYCERVNGFAYAEADDTSMIGRHQWAEREKLLKSLERCYPEQVALFFMHARLVNPEVELPIEEWFNSVLLKDLSDELEPEKAAEITNKILSYLDTGQDLESLTPKALGVPKLQGWDPYARYRGQVAPSELIWLLPEQKAKRLAVFFSQLGKRGLHWMMCNFVEQAHAIHCIQTRGLNLTERWTDEHIGHNTINQPSYSTALTRAREEWALNWLDDAGVNEFMLLYFAAHEAREPAEFVQRLAKEGRIPDLKAWLTAAERLKLVELLEQGDVDSYRDGLQVFLNDSSIEVRKAAQKLLGSE
ncbi:hypothetical protein [Vibrio intestinalis]|uniref:hypothetical protein n=1 Tax=Vibrio intestinalis TaxID=2933291 RepID=UPI0021A65B10|nr:hypothetical protein [Vibrio intestinalis]